MEKWFFLVFFTFQTILNNGGWSLNRRNEIVCITHLLLYKIRFIHSFPYLFSPDLDPQIYADPDPNQAKTCWSVRIRIQNTVTMKKLIWSWSAKWWSFFATNQGYNQVSLGMLNAKIKDAELDHNKSLLRQLIGKDKQTRVDPERHRSFSASWQVLQSMGWEEGTHRAQNTRPALGKHNQGDHWEKEGSFIIIYGYRIAGLIDW